MQKFEEREITKPFHLALKDYQKLFTEFQAIRNYIIVVGLNPIPELSGLIVQKTNVNKKDITSALAHKGVMIISVGEDVKTLKEGDLVLCPHEHVVEYAIKREIHVKDVFPRVRKYTLMVIPEHGCPLKINVDPNILDHVTDKANIDAEEKAFQTYQENITKRENDINL